MVTTFRVTPRRWDTPSYKWKKRSTLAPSPHSRPRCLTGWTHSLHSRQNKKATEQVVKPLHKFQRLRKTWLCDEKQKTNQRKRFPGVQFLLPHITMTNRRAHSSAHARQNQQLPPKLQQQGSGTEWGRPLDGWRPTAGGKVLKVE